MATLALGAAFSGLATAVGASATIAPIITGVGVAVGSFIDNTFLLPALFPPPDIEGPRLSEIRTSFAEEGSPVNFGLGTAVRTNGIVIWISDLQEIKITDEVGGKGGGGQKVTRYEYVVSMACLIAKVDGNAMSQLIEIIASGKPVYRVPQTITFSGTVAANAVLTIQGQTVWDITIATGIELGSFIAGGSVTVSGFSNGANNGTFTIIASSSDAGAGTSRLRLRNSLGVAEGSASVTITQNVEAFNESGAEDIEIYTGSISQSPSPTIEEFEGVGNVPAYRGYAYVVLKNLNLTEFGNIPPQLNFIWNPGTSTNIGAMVNALASRAGLGSSWAEVDPLVTETVNGYPVQGAIGVSSAIQPLAIAGNILAQNRDNSIRVFPRTTARIIDVPAEELAAHEYGGESRERPLQVQDASEHEVARGVTVKYLDNQQRYQGGAQKAIATAGGTEGVERVVNLPLVLTNGAQDAQEIAQRTVFDSFNRRELIRLSLSPAWMHVQENDVLRVNALGRIWYLLVRRVDRGQNYVLQLECTAELRDSLIQVAASEEPGGAAVPFQTTSLFIIFYPNGGPGPTPGPAPRPGPRPGPPSIIVPMIHTDPDRPDTIGRVFSKPESAEDDEYEELGILGVESVLGYTLGALGGTDITGDFEDTTNTVDVELFGGSMASPADVTAWRNGALAVQIGDEVVFAKTATLIDVRTYRLSGLLRGLHGTRGAMGTHGATEPVTVLSAPGILDSVIEIPYRWVGTTRSIKVVPSGRDLSEVEAVDLPLDFCGVVPLPPVDLVSNRDTTGNVALRWSRVALEYFPLFGEVQAPLYPIPREVYELEITDSDGGDPLLTLGLEDAHEIEITQTQLTSAGIATGDNVFVTVYQVNPQLGGTGRGSASEQHEVGISPVP